MEIILESNLFEQKYKTKVVGVTFTNADGKQRQTLLKYLTEGEPIYLLRDRQNEHSKNAVAVYDKNHQQLGYLSDDDRLAKHIDMGGKTNATAFRKIGGPSFFERLFGMKGKSYGLIIEIGKSFDWKSITPIQDEDKKIAAKALKAKNLESTDPAKAIEAYQAIIESIVQFDRKSEIHPYWRRVRIPVDRISLLYDKTKQYDKGIEVLRWYFNYTDAYPHSDSVMKTLVLRFERLLKKLGAEQV